MSSKKSKWVYDEIIEYNSEIRFAKVADITAFIFIILSLTIIIITPPASGYEISIYNVYPWYFWVFVITSIFIGQMVIWGGGDGASKICNNYWKIGFLGILLTNTILLFMPFIRGYTTYGRGDVLTHIGIIKDILNTASIGTNNFYPLDHILTAILSHTTNINVEHAVNVIPPIFSLFYIISIYIFVREIFGDKKEIKAVLAFTSILLFCNTNLIFAPSVQSFFLLPFVFYAYFKSRGLSNPLEFSIILIISLFCVVFFHPMTTLFLMLIFLILELCLFIYKKLKGTHIYKKYNLPEISTFNIILMSFVTFFTWYFSFTAITNSFRKVTNSLFYDSGATEIGKYTELLTRTQPAFYDLIEVILNTFGQIIVLGSLSLLFSIYIFNMWRKNTENNGLNFYHFFFSLATITFIILSIIFFFNDFIIGFGRVSKYTFFFSSVFVGLGFYLLLNKPGLSFSKQRIFSISFCIVLIILLYFSTFNLYFSPRIKAPNQQVTETEITGMTWFFDHRNINIQIQEIGLSQRRFHDAIYGRYEPAKNIRYGIDTMPVDHFDYMTNTSFGDYYEEQNYMLISIIGRIIYPELHPKYKEQWRFTPDDFRMLEDDNTVLRIYDNQNLNIYFID